MIPVVYQCEYESLGVQHIEDRGCSLVFTSARVSPDWWREDPVSLTESCPLVTGLNIHHPHLTLASHHPPLTSHHPLLTSHYPPLTSHHPLLTSYHFLLTSHHPLFILHIPPTYLTLPFIYLISFNTSQTSRHPWLATYSSSEYTPLSGSED